MTQTQDSKLEEIYQYILKEKELQGTLPDELEFDAYAKYRLQTESGDGAPKYQGCIVEVPNLYPVYRHVTIGNETFDMYGSNASVKSFTSTVEQTWKNNVNVHVRYFN